MRDPRRSGKTWRGLTGAPPPLCTLYLCAGVGAGPLTPAMGLLSYSKLKETARAVGRVIQDCKIAIDPDEYADRFNPDLVEVSTARASEELDRGVCASP